VAKTVESVTSQFANFQLSVPNGRATGNGTEESGTGN
jgi:hypothetical protein